MRWMATLPLVLVLILVATLTAAAQGPELTVRAPAPGQEIIGTEVTVTFTTANINLVRTTVPVEEAGKHPEANRPGEGHLHFMLDLQPLVVWEKPDPYTFSDVPPGDHQLMVELVNNDHSPLSPRVAQTIQFRTGGAPPLMPTTGKRHPLDVDPGLAVLVLGVALLVAAGLARGRRAH